jgi:hypoxanthine phosphoribosyltransferase
VQETVRNPDLVADVAEVLITEAQIQEKVRELGRRLSADYANQPVTLVSVLKGSLPFMADLMRAIEVPLQIDLMEVSSDGGATTETSGLVRILKDLSSSIAGKDVLIVEDIIDTGLTLNYLLRYLRGKNPRSLRICALLDKPARRLVEIPIDYRGFTISSWATAWTTASTTATCRSSASSDRRSTSAGDAAGARPRSPAGIARRTGHAGRHGAAVVDRRWRRDAGLLG